MKRMMVVNLKAYTTPQLLSAAAHGQYCSPLPMFINYKSRSCPTDKHQIMTSCSSKVPRFGIGANAMASKEIIPLSSPHQPYPKSTPFPSFDHPLLVVLEKSIQHAAHMVDTALLVECLENLEEKLSKANVFSALFCTIKQIFTNMDKVVVLSELLLLAEKSSITFNLRKMQIIQLCNKRMENMQAEYWEEFPETPKEIFKAFMRLIFTDNNLRASLTDASTNKLIEDPNALTMFRIWPRIRNFLALEKPVHPSSPDFGKGPHAEHEYTFYYGSNDPNWINEFKNKVEKVINDQFIQDKKVRIGSCCINGDQKKNSEAARVLSGTCHDIVQYYLKSPSHGWFMLTKNNKVVLHGSEGPILKVLEEFQLWKDDVVENGFGTSFKKYYNAN